MMHYVHTGEAVVTSIKIDIFDLVGDVNQLRVNNFLLNRWPITPVAFKGA